MMGSVMGGPPQGSAPYRGAPMGGAPVLAQMGGMMPQNQLIRNDSDANLCKVCMVNRINTVMVPCGHQCICSECAKTLNKECPICRKRVTQVVKTFGT